MTIRATSALFLGFAVLLALPHTASAQRLVSIKGQAVNMRAEPTVAGQVLWQLGAGYPLKVVARKGNWIQVVDFENDRGWVARRLTSTTPHSVVKAPRVNVRSGPGLGFRILRKADYGEVFRILGKRNSWIRVQGPDARTGWIAGRLLWGF